MIRYSTKRIKTEGCSGVKGMMHGLTYVKNKLLRQSKAST